MPSKALAPLPFKGQLPGPSIPAASLKSSAVGHLVTSHTRKLARASTSVASWSPGLKARDSGRAGVDLPVLNLSDDLIRLDLHLIKTCPAIAKSVNAAKPGHGEKAQRVWPTSRQQVPTQV